MAKKTKKTGKVPQQVLDLRKARRQVEIDLQTPKEFSKVWLTSKKDKANLEKNTLKDIDEC